MSKIDARDSLLSGSALKMVDEECLKIRRAAFKAGRIKDVGCVPIEEIVFRSQMAIAAATELNEKYEADRERFGVPR